MGTQDKPHGQPGHLNIYTRDQDLEMGSEMVQVGDFVRHPDDKKLYRIEQIDGETVYLDDGGLLGIGECTDILLESEAYDEFHRQVR